MDTVEVAYNKILKLFKDAAPPYPGMLPNTDYYMFWLYDYTNPWGEDGIVHEKDNVYLEVVRKSHETVSHLQGRCCLAVFIEDEAEYDLYNVVSRRLKTTSIVGIKTYLNYFSDAVPCNHNDVIDNGTRVSECRHCRARMEFINWQWVLS